MRVAAWLGLLIALFPAVGSAGELEGALRARWLGAWVVVKTELASDCGGLYTDNRIHGELVKSGGRWRFQPGELAKLDKVDVNRSRIDLHLSLAEPMLLPWQDGPFTLYRETGCKVELEVAVRRDAVKKKQADAIDGMIAEVLDRFSTESAARDSERWNGRVREEYPDDYETTLEEYAVWKAEQRNATVQARIDHAMAETARLADRIVSNPDYLAGLADGVGVSRTSELTRCETMVALDLVDLRRQTARLLEKSGPHPPDYVRGFEDGRVLVHGLSLLRGLGACFVPVPEIGTASQTRVAERGIAR